MPDAPPSLPFPDRRQNLPPPERFPHNEQESSAFAVLDEDQVGAKDLLLVVRSADRRGLARLLARRAELPLEGEPLVRVLLERPVCAYTRGRTLGKGELELRLREDWVREGVSLTDAPWILGAQRLLSEHKVEARAAHQERQLLASGQLTDSSLSLGGSAAGLGADRNALVALARFHQAEDPARLDEGRALLEELWDVGVGFDLRAVLAGLLTLKSWEAALARAIALILEGAWARSYVPPRALDQLEKPLLRHQLSGLGQALWLLDHVGVLLVADPTGSGKTRLGARILRAAVDRCARSRAAVPQNPLMLAPPAMTANWETALAEEAGLSWRVVSLGKLAQEPEGSHSGRQQGVLMRTIRSTELLAVDEAHNFHNLHSKRSRALLEQSADHVLLFTATPISRKATDLHSLVELLGADHLSDFALEALDKLSRSQRSLHDQESVEVLQNAVASFTLRRTRAEIDETLRQDPHSKFRYPTRKVSLYEVACPTEDLALLERIVELARQLRGVHLVGREISLPPALAATGWSEERYLDVLPRRCAALARFELVSAVRSSRAAVWELIRGTVDARGHFGLSVEQSGKRSHTGAVVQKLQKMAGSLPSWRLSDAVKTDGRAWLWDQSAHVLASEQDQELYKQILKVVDGLSDARERARSSLLAQLVHSGRKVLAFERRLITLDVMNDSLRSEGFPIQLLTGSARASRKKAEACFGLNSPPEARLGLLSDSFAESLNLQGANIVVHLDFPTVLRLAEQRTGRIDRMDSPHAEIDIFLPRDPEVLAPQKGEALIYRDWLSDRVFGGSNMEYPEGLHDERLNREDFRRRLQVPEDSQVGMDAFRPLRDLVGEGSLVSEETYASERDQQDPMSACISAVWGAQPWAFFAVRGGDGEAPRWVMKSSPWDPPIVDLGDIAALLRDHINVFAQPCPVDANAGQIIQQHLDALEREESHLLRPQLRRALEVVQDHLKTLLHRGLMLTSAQRERVSDCLDILQRKSFDGRVPNLRRLGEVCLDQLRPLRLRWLLRPRSGRRQLFLLKSLKPMLEEEHLDLDELHARLRSVGLVQPLRERIFVAIIGVPAQHQGPTDLQAHPTRAAPYVP